MSERPKPVNCPICGAKAFVKHFSVDGFEFGWGAGCPRFKRDDKYHHIPAGAPESECPRVMEMATRDGAVEAWNKKAEAMKRSRQIQFELNHTDWNIESRFG